MKQLTTPELIACRKAIRVDIYFIWHNTRVFTSPEFHRLVKRYRNICNIILRRYKDETARINTTT